MSQAYDLNTGETVVVSPDRASALNAEIQQALADAREEGWAVGFHCRTVGCVLGFYPDSYEPADDDDDDDDNIGAALPLMAMLPGMIPIAQEGASALIEASYRATERRLRRRARRGGAKGRAAKAKLKAFLSRKASREVRQERAAQRKLQTQATAPASGMPSIPGMPGFPGTSSIPGLPRAGMPLMRNAPQSPQSGWGLLQQGLTQLTPSRSNIGGSVSTVYPRVWSNSVIGADYVHDELDVDDFGNFLGDEGGQPDDIDEMASFDAEMADIDEEDDGDDSIGGRRKRLSRVKRRQRRINARLNRAKTKGRPRRARRLAARLKASEKLVKKMSTSRRARRQVRKAARRGASITDVSRVRPGQKPSGLEAVAQTFSPDLPVEGRLVTVPLEISNLPYTTGTLAVVTTASKTVSALKSFESDGVSYAELELIGLLVEMTSKGPAGHQAGLEVTAIAGDGNLPGIYGNQPTLVDTDGYSSGPAATPVQNAVGFARIVIIGLRDKAEIARTQKIKATVRVFAMNAAIAGTFSYLLTCQAILNTISDPNAASSV